MAEYIVEKEDIDPSNKELKIKVDGEGKVIVESNKPIEDDKYKEVQQING